MNNNIVPGGCYQPGSRMPGPPRSRWWLAILVPTLGLLAFACICISAAHADADPLAGIAIAQQHHRYDYRRAAFGEAWDNGGPCDTRDEILNRDLTEVTHV